MARMIVLDASVVIAFLDASDSHHQQASELIGDHAVGGFRMHQLTLAEVLVGASRAGRANQLHDDLAAIGVQAHGPMPQEPLLLAELRATTGLKMPDCCVLAVARHESAPLATFDQQLTRTAAALGLQTLP
jgi:predicted nucleic acid-binding protein